MDNTLVNSDAEVSEEESQEAVVEYPFQFHISEEDAKQIKNPFLMEDVLDKVFAFFETDIKSLCSFREVCTTWNQAASRKVKKCGRWKIGKGKNHQNESAFIRVMSACKDDVFRNFHICNKIKYDTLSTFHQSKPTTMLERKHAILAFLEKFGHLVIDLKLAGLDTMYISDLCEFLPNLEHLQLYGILPDMLENAKLKAISFPKLKSVSFNGALNYTSSKKTCNAMICSGLVKNSSQLRELEINTPLKSDKFFNSMDLRCLTSLTMIPATLFDHEYYAFPLNARDLSYISKKCPNIKILSLLIQDLVAESRIFDMIYAFSQRLQELHIEIFTGSVSDGFHLDDGTNNDESGDEDEEEEEGQHDVEDEDDDYYNLRRKITRFSFPDCPLLEKLILRKWGSFDNYNIKFPSLKYIDFQIRYKNNPIVLSPSGHLNVTYLKFIQAEPISKETITSFGALFPNLLELNVCVIDDEALRAIYTTMPKLEKLHLNKSLITDAGITGIKLDALKLKFRFYTVEDYVGVDVGYMRKFPCISELKNLQHFTFNGNTLSKYSIYYGFILLKKLTYLKVSPYYSIRRFNRFIEKVHVRALVDNCPMLWKLDVNGFPNISQIAVTTSNPEGGEEGDDADDNDEEEENDHNYDRPGSQLKLDLGGGKEEINYVGCGLPNDDVEYIKGKLPNLELVYRESKTIEDLEEEADEYDNVILVV